MTKEYDVKHEDHLISHHQATINLANTSKEFYVSHISCHKNMYVNVLALLVVTLALPARSRKHVTIGVVNFFALKRF